MRRLKKKKTIIAEYLAEGKQDPVLLAKQAYNESDPEARIKVSRIKYLVTQREDSRQ